MPELFNSMNRKEISVMDENRKRETAKSASVKERWLTVKEVSDLLGISPKTVYQWVELRIVPHYKFVGSVRFLESEIVEWAKTCKVEPLKVYNLTIQTKPEAPGRR
ncbi:MAG: helix-turn-helix domain-containing protein [Nitrospiraceae bacterium]|nr:helix-turn-helix domain-containing protein [Nitrospiraceae bacterium]